MEHASIFQRKLSKALTAHSQASNIHIVMLLLIVRYGEEEMLDANYCLSPVTTLNPG